MLISPFFDREEYIESFKLNMKNVDKDRYKVLVYYGVPGVGKTSLMEELSQIVEEHNSRQESIEIIWERIDLSVQSFVETDTFLFALRDKLSRKYRVSFPFFDIAHAIYIKKAYPNKPLKNENYSFYDEKSIMSGSAVIDLIETLDTMPQPKFLTKLKQCFKNAFIKYDQLQRMQIEEISRLPNLETKDIKKLLPTYWALDFKEYLKKYLRSAVIFIDTYEAFQIKVALAHPAASNGVCSRHRSKFRYRK